MKPIIVVKAGTSSLTNSQGKPNEEVLAELCRQLSELWKKHRVILVSSGAVGYGRKFLKKYIGTIAQRRAAASVGNVLLIENYSQHFAKYKINVAQALCERQHFSNRKKFLHLRETFETLWDSGLLPIVNENDVVSDHELKFSDNDELATLLAVGFSAQKLFLGTTVPGVLDGRNEVIPLIENFDEKVLGLAKNEKSEFGLGGMISKLNCAKLATRLGCETVIFDVRIPGNLLLADEGKTGTICTAKICDISAHQRWIASGSVITGRVKVDSGAADALRKRKSLLAVGVKEILGDFQKSEFFEIFEEGKKFPIAVARAEISSDELSKRKDLHGLEMAHADEIVLM